MRVDNLIGNPFHELSEVDSTNNYAMRQVQADLAGHGATWFASHQNSGKGQRQKSWFDEPGKNIIMSTVIQPHVLSVENQFLVAIVAALACHDLFSFYATNKTRIKWPNDIYWKDRKAGGILIENIIKGREWRHSVIGIGININQTLFPPAIPNPVSLKQITGKTFDLVELAKQLCGYLNNRWQQLLTNGGDGLLSEYNARLYKLGDMVSFEKESLIFDAVVGGVNKKGELLIITGKKSEPSALTFGSVKWNVS